jgi:hypothetical protein
VGPEPFNTPADCAGKIKKWEKGISPKNMEVKNYGYGSKNQHNGAQRLQKPVR